VLVLTPLAVLSALTIGNGGFISSLASQYGDELMLERMLCLSLKDGPFFTLVALGASGLAHIPFMSLIATLLPIVIGMILGNLDPDMRKFLGSSNYY
jgi:2-keto-3-deoxygluconate permease